MNLDDLDEWTLHCVLDFLTLKEISRFRSVCRRFKQAVDSYGTPHRLRGFARIDTRPVNDWTTHDAWNRRRRVYTSTGRLLGSYMFGDRGGWVAPIDSLGIFLRKSLGLEVPFALIDDTNEDHAGVWNDVYLHLRAMPASEQEIDAWFDAHVKKVPAAVADNAADGIHVIQLVYKNGRKLGSVRVRYRVDYPETRREIAQQLGLEADVARALRLTDQHHDEVWMVTLLGLPAPQAVLDAHLEELLARHVVRIAVPSLITQ